jgi:hypothetical protein
LKDRPGISLVAYGAIQLLFAQALIAIQLLFAQALIAIQLLFAQALIAIQLPVTRLTVSEGECLLVLSNILSNEGSSRMVRKVFSWQS